MAYLLVHGNALSLDGGISLLMEGHFKVGL